MYTVSEYLDMMEAADRAPGTIRSYRVIFESFGRFLGVPVDKIHDHLEPENLIKYAGSMKTYSGQTVRQRLAILRAYFVENGVQFRKLEMKVLTARRRTEPDDKPPTLDLLQRMMDVADDRGRAFITFSVSTAMRPGEAAQVLLSDVDGDTVTIRPEIAKNRHGGKAYLTAEAREYLDIWLKNRNKFIKLADLHTDVLRKGGIKSKRPRKDPRLFASSYNGLQHMFARLYTKVDGERGRFRARITPHSCRKYFRTQAARTMPLDLVEHLMRHSGYLTGSYRRIPEEEARRLFHEGEHALYITRADQRLKQSEIDRLKRENVELSKRIDTHDNETERRIKALEILVRRAQKPKT